MDRDLLVEATETPLTIPLRGAVTNLHPPLHLSADAFPSDRAVCSLPTHMNVGAPIAAKNTSREGAKMSDVRDGTLKGGLPYLALGEGPPLVVFPGSAPTHANPNRLQRRFAARFFEPLARGFTVYNVNRKVGLGPDTTMADLADDYALALEAEFGGPVHVLGISTGGSVAQQFAVDHPNLLRRLVLAGTAHRLGPVAREAQRRGAGFAARGDYRRSLAAAAPSLAGSRMGQRLLGTALWLMAPYVGMGRGWNPSDMIATIRAEDAFDIADRLGEVRAPTLLIAGDRDRNFGMESFERTAALIPDSRLIIYEGRGHGGTFTDRRFARDVVAFLKAKDPTVSAGKPYGSPRGAR